MVGVSLGGVREVMWSVEMGEVGIVLMSREHRQVEAL